VVLHGHDRALPSFPTRRSSDLQIWRSDVVADHPAGVDYDLPVDLYAHVAHQHVDVDRTPVETAGIVPVVPEAEVTGPEHRLLGLGAGESLVMRTQAQLPHEGGGVVGLHGLP